MFCWQNISVVNALELFFCITHCCIFIWIKEIKLYWSRDKDSGLSGAHYACLWNQHDWVIPKHGCRDWVSAVVPKWRCFFKSVHRDHYPCLAPFPRFPISKPLPVDADLIYSRYNEVQYLTKPHSRCKYEHIFHRSLNLSQALLAVGCLPWSSCPAGSAALDFKMTDSYSAFNPFSGCYSNGSF